MLTGVSEELPASIFRVWSSSLFLTTSWLLPQFIFDPEDNGSRLFLTVGVNYYQTTRHHIPE
jgi:hypothetical protein